MLFILTDTHFVYRGYELFGCGLLLMDRCRGKSVSKWWRLYRRRHQNCRNARTASNGVYWY